MKSIVFFVLVCTSPMLCFAPAGSSSGKVVRAAALHHETYERVLTDALNRALSPHLRGSLHLVDANAGPVMWYYMSPSGYFNEQTFNYISRRVTGSNGDLAELSEAGGFPNAYSTVLQLLYYNVGTADRAKLEAAGAASQGFADSTVANYERVFGTITLADMAAAFSLFGQGVTGKMDYIIDVKMAIYWSGRATGGAPPLSFSQMATATNIDSLLPLMPSAGSPVVAWARKFMVNSMTIAGIVDSAQNAAWTLRQLKNNTQYPNSLNGGMQLINPFNGNSAGYQVGYTVANSLGELSAQLQDSSRRIVVTVTAYQSGGGVVDIVAGWGSGRADTITYTLPDSIYVDFGDTLAMLVGAMDETVAVATFKKFAIVNTGPQQWRDTANTGWYFAYPINQAILHDTFDVTGYKFVLPSPYNMNRYEACGAFGYLQQLMVCAERPEVVVNTNPLTVRSGANNSGIPRAMVPAMQSTAFVVGGVFGFPQGR